MDKCKKEKENIYKTTCKDCEYNDNCENVTKKGENKMKEENTISIVNQRELIEITKNLGRFLTKEEFEEIIMIYNEVIERLWEEL